MIKIMSRECAKQKEGFTLIELLVIIAIIGLLASIVLVSVGPSRKKARDARRESDIRQINLAMEMCYDDSECAGFEKYPTWDTDSEAVDLTGEKIGGGGNFYIEIPADPLNDPDNDFAYKYYAGDDQRYCIAAKLEAPASTTWVCASNHGVKQHQSETEPDESDCCGMSL